MRNGEVTWKAPSAAAPFTNVRRFSFGPRICEVMCCSFSCCDALSSTCDLPGAFLGTPGNSLVHQAGHCILQPVASTGPAAFSPGTGLLMVNILSESPCGGCASPTNTVLISWWSPDRYSGAAGCSAISGGSLKPDSACASF